MVPRAPRRVDRLRRDAVSLPFAGALAGALAVGIATTLIAGIAFRSMPAAAVPVSAVPMFGFIGAVLGVIADAVASASE